MEIDKIGLHKNHYKGASNELKSQQFFLDKGCQVYTPIVQQSHVDFVVSINNELKKIQVKTAWYIKSGNYKYLQCRINTTNKYKTSIEESYDYLFIVYNDEYWLIPSKEIKSSNISLKNNNKNNKEEDNKWYKFKIKGKIND